MPVVAQAGQAGAVDRHEPVEELRDELGHAVFFEERLDRGGAARRLQVHGVRAIGAGAAVRVGVNR